MFVLRRSTHNPILKPTGDHAWESFATFNWCPIQDRSKIHCLYRAESEEKYVHGQRLRISSIGYARSKDGRYFEERHQLVYPEREWEKFGCEDPRVTKIGNKYYIFYTALSTFPFSAAGIKVALAITKNFKTIEEKHLVTPFNAKAMTLFPEKINGKYVAMLSAHTDEPPAKMAIAKFDNLEQIWSEDYWRAWHTNIDENKIELRRTDTDHVEIGAPPIKTKKGWLLIYSHIQNYFTDRKIFGIEAVLLDLKDPSKIIARTPGPMLVPEEIFEEFGQVPNVIFPTGCFLHGKVLHIYYGATDTTGCRAKVYLEDLLSSMKREPVFVRHENNPILKPIESNKWENKEVFNPAAIELKGKTYIVYRAMGDDDTSVMGLAISKNGKDIDQRLSEPIYVPREPFESKYHPGNSGCEDPRLTLMGDNLHMFYTAYDGNNPPVVAASVISIKDFLVQNWNWSKPQLVTPYGIDNKDACLFPEKIGGHYHVLHRANNHICFDPIMSLDYKIHRVESFTPIVGPRQGMWDSAKVGIAGPPLKTKKGWLLFYHGVSDNSTYRVGAVLLDLRDPRVILSRTTDSILEPEMDYEKIGIIPNVVFPCGAVVKKETVFMYYGGADTVVGVATAKLSDILKKLVI